MKTLTIKSLISIEICVIRNKKAVFCLPSQQFLLINWGQIIRKAPPLFLPFLCPSLPQIFFPSPPLLPPLPFLPPARLSTSSLRDNRPFSTQENRDTPKLPGCISEAGHSIFLRTKPVISCPFCFLGSWFLYLAFV